MSLMRFAIKCDCSSDKNYLIFLIQLRVTTHKRERMARARLLLNAVESKIASSKGREVLTEFCHALMRDLHLRLLGQEMASQANIAEVSVFS